MLAKMLDSAIQYLPYSRCSPGPARDVAAAKNDRSHTVRNRSMERLMQTGELAKALGCEIHGDPTLEITSLAGMEQAVPGQLTFLANPKYAHKVKHTRASAILAAQPVTDSEITTLVSANPYLDFARALEFFYRAPRPEPGIHPLAFVAASAQIGENASVGAYAVIGAGVRIGRDAVIHPHATIYPNVTAGDNFTCHSHASIREGTTIGNRVTIMNNAVIGADGFGYVEADGGLVKIPQVGTVLIEDDVEIGANTTVDRAMIGVTILHRGVKTDDQVHIGHNCEIGEYSRFSAFAGVSGSVRVGKWTQWGGQTGSADHIKIGDRAMIGAQAGVHNDIEEGAVVLGSPAIDVRKARRYMAILPRLPELFRRLRVIERHVGIESRE